MLYPVANSSFYEGSIDSGYHGGHSHLSSLSEVDSSGRRLGKILGSYQTLMCWVFFLFLPSTAPNNLISAVSRSRGVVCDLRPPRSPTLRWTWLVVA
ncbi:hypothetical protein MSAN_00148800 [Mycena sanguinolenta]|uniref:Uncharacterized protein n=1 Tax=Mycena sanguinolenta TaxID=230812 RepID=A0A8H6ZKQ6_9AGAR|nr:hypothetical protein MSAN_00148800 [Mycena sanguinolenta]